MRRKRLSRFQIRFVRSLRNFRGLFIDTPNRFRRNTYCASEIPLEPLLPEGVHDLYQLYEHICNKYGALVLFANKNLTYAQVLPLVRSRAAFLLSEGFKKDDVIAILAHNSEEWCITYMAITSIGATALVLDFNLRESFYGPMLSGVNAKAIFMSSAFEYTFPGVKKYDIGLSVNMGDNGSFTPVQVPDTTIASLIYTSGTTAVPKVVQLTHANIYKTGIGVLTNVYRGTPMNVLGLLPLYHVYGFTTTFMAPFCGGLRIVFQTSFKSSDLLNTLKTANIHMFPVVPQILEIFLDKIIKKIKEESTFKYNLFTFIVENAPSLHHIGLGFLVRKVCAPVRAVFGKEFKFFLSGGARLRLRTGVYYRNMGLCVVEGYGLTETVGPIAGNMLERPQLICVSKPCPGNEVQIRNINREGIGEIWLRGVSVMPGYYNNDAANDLVFDNEGWFDTGDMGFLDKNRDLHIRGRKKNVIVLDSGKNVYPEELESYYMQSDLFEDLVIFGKKVNGKEVVYSVIKPAFEKTVDAYKKIKAELKKMNHGLPTYKIIGMFALTFDPLPKTSTQKVIVRDVIKELEAGAYQTQDVVPGNKTA